MSRTPHICMLTAHSTDDYRVRNKVGQALVDAGFRVTWVGPDYAMFDRPPEPDDGIDYRLVRRPQGKRQRLLLHLRIEREARSIPGVDVYCTSEPDTQVVALRLASRSRARVVFDIHEVFHDAVLGGYLDGLPHRVVGGVARRLIARMAQRSDLVVGVSNSVLEPYAEVTTEKLVVRSCAPEWFGTDPASDVCGPDRQHFTLMHGKAIRTRGTELVMQSLAIASQRADGLRGLFFDLFGRYGDGFGKPEFLAYVDELGIGEQVDLRQRVPMQQMPAVLRECDAGLITYGRAFGVDSLPNRLFEYLAAGLPVIVPEYSREIVAIVRAEQCGLTADTEQPESIAEAIVQMRSNPDETREMGRRAREAYDLRHNWKVEVEPLVERIRSWG